MYHLPKTEGRLGYEAFRAGVSLKDIAASGNSLKRLRENVDLNEVFSKIEIQKPDISKLSDHSLKRFSERGVSMSDLQNVIDSPLKKYEVRDNGTYKIVGEYATIGVSVTTGRITTAWRTGTSTLRKIERESKK